MNKITDAESYEDFEKYCLDKNYTLSELSSKKSYFIRKDEGGYANIISWIDTFREKYTTKRKITQSKATEYLGKYGATKAVRVLSEEGVIITRQGLYKAADNER